MVLFELTLHWQILLALALAVLIGLIVDRDTAVTGVTFYAVFDFVGELFLNALKMLIVPLIVSSIIVGVSGIGLILAVDRILDMMRTSVNVFSDSCYAVIIAKSEGERGILQD